MDVFATESSLRTTRACLSAVPVVALPTQRHYGGKRPKSKRLMVRRHS